MKIEIEVTDTFGGDANYCWVNRYEIESKENETDLAFMRRVKRVIGWNGLPCRTNDFGDMIEIRPYRICQVCFVTFRS